MISLSQSVLDNYLDIGRVVITFIHPTLKIWMLR